MWPDAVPALVPNVPDAVPACRMTCSLNHSIVCAGGSSSEDGEHSYDSLGGIMNGKTRILACCEHKPVDRIPTYHCNISSRSASIILGREAYVGGAIQRFREAVALWTGEDAHAEFLERTKRDTIDLGTVLDLDMVRVSYWRLDRKPTRRIDDNTFYYGDPDGKWEVMRFDPDTELYQTVDWSPRPEETMEDVERQVEHAERGAENYKPTKEDFPDILMGIAAYGGERAIPGTGVGIAIQRTEMWLEAIVTRPDLVERALDAQVVRAVKNIEALADVDVHVMLGGGDMASNQGPIYSPRAFRELIVPRQKKVTEACRKHGKYHFFASDGNLWPIAEDLFPAVQGFYEIDSRAGMDPCLLREQYPHVTLLGSISSHTLHLGTKEEVIAETLYCIEAAKKYGSMVVGCSNLIMSQTPEENLLAMLDTIRENR